MMLSLYIIALAMGVLMASDGYDFGYLQIVVISVLAPLRFGRYLRLGKKS